MLSRFATADAPTPSSIKRWVAAHLLQEYEYPCFIESMGWQPRSWITVARHIYDLGLMARRKNDRRSGPHRRGSCRTEYLVPRLGSAT